MTLPLARRLREDTWHLHTRAEQAGVMPALLQGKLPRPAYATLLQQLHALYLALEAALDRQAGHPWLAAWQMPALRRAPALVDDLAVLAGPADSLAAPDHPALLPAMDALCTRIDSLAATEPGLLLAHAYVRYLGDLSGGQVLARRVQAAYGLAPGAGTRFYDFGEPAAAAALLGRCRQALADTVPTPAECDALVAEACWCFEQHVALFEQLASLPPGEPGQPAQPGHPAPRGPTA